MTQVAAPSSLPANMDQLELAFNGIEYKVERRRDGFRLQATGRRQLQRRATDRPRNGFAHVASPMARDRPGPHARAISLRLHRRGENVGAGQSDVFDAAGPEGILFNWSVEW